MSLENSPEHASQPSTNENEEDELISSAFVSKNKFINKL